LTFAASAMAARVGGRQLQPVHGFGRVLVGRERMHQRIRDLGRVGQQQGQRGLAAGVHLGHAASILSRQACQISGAASGQVRAKRLLALPSGP
jgi:hypothetical protein